MEFGNNATLLSLIRLLTSGKRDGLIQLNGKWGTGKTYFAQNTFRDMYKKKPTFMISLLGVKNLEDFKSQLLSEYFLKVPDELKNAPDILSSVASLSLKKPASANAINKLITGIIDSIKLHQLSSLEGLFFIDDIERVDAKVSQDVLTFCHSVYMKNDNVDFVIISNISEESSLNIGHYEKLISDVVDFIPTEDDIYSLFSEKLEPFSEKNLLVLKESIKKFNLQNIRIIKNVICGLYPIFKYHIDNPEKEVKASLDLLINAYAAMIILRRKYQAGSKLVNYTMGINSERDTSEEGVLKEAASASGVHKIIKKYAFSQASAQDVCEIIFVDKPKVSLEEIVLSDDLFSNSIDEKKAIDCIKKMIRSEDTPLVKWLDAVRVYKNLERDKYIKHDIAFENNTLMVIADRFKAQEVETLLNVNSENIASPEELEKARANGNFTLYLKLKHAFDIRPIELENMKNDLLGSGWLTFDTQRIERRAKHSQIEYIGHELFSDAIINKWKIEDIISFRRYIEGAYSFSNIEDYFSRELPHLSALSKSLLSHLDGNEYSFKYGCINALNDTIEGIIKRLGPRLK